MFVEYIYIINIQTPLGQSWLQFFGGYLGAIMGFIGVIITLIYSYKQYIYQQEELNSPYLTLSAADKSTSAISFVDAHITWSVPDNDNIEDDLKIFTLSSINFINDSNALIKDLSVKSITMTDTREQSVNREGFYSLIDHPRYPLGLFELKFIPDQMRIGITIKFEFLKISRIPELSTTYSKEKIIELTNGYINIIISYKNKLNNLFEQEFKIKYKIMIDNKTTKVFFDLSNSYIGCPTREKTSN